MAQIAVIDVETTGLNPYRHDRIVEIAVLVFSPDGNILREFISLVNPERDIGPTRIHGLRTRDIITAPRFSEIAGSLLDILNGCVALAGHNVRFDHSFLSVEFDRIGYPLKNIQTICTMQLSGGGSLSCNCSDYGIEFQGDMHSAKYDAYATAKLLTAILNDAPLLKSRVFCNPPIVWPKIPKAHTKLLTREDLNMSKLETPTYIKKLLTRIVPDIPPENEQSSIYAYTALLDRVLEDGQIDEREGISLFELALHWDIPGERIKKVHWDYMLRLCTAALADDVLTDSEYRELSEVASLLGIDSQNLDHILEHARQQSPKIKTLSLAVNGIKGREQFTGKSVCFTGECQCGFKNMIINREMATNLAKHEGMVVVESVTKKLDILVVADPLTQSGKAKKAKRYGIRIMHEPVFWRALGLEVR